MSSDADEPMMLKAPFPWFGGKSRAAADIWSRLGDVSNYVEPFAGSLAVLLLRPSIPKIETVNDLDCYVANFWRALANNPELVASCADWPVNEADLHSRHLWLVGREDFRRRMKSDPDYYDAKIAGWWCWGQAMWIGSGWCDSKYYYDSESDLTSSVDAANRLSHKRPHLGDAGKGVHRLSHQLPHLGDAGQGVHRLSHKLPHLGDAGKRVHISNQNQNLYEYFDFLSRRLRRVRVTCGNWDRVLGDSVTTGLGVTGILLDPPYSHGVRDPELYATEMDVTSDVLDWALQNGSNPMLRIALCGYDVEYESLQAQGWQVHTWSAPSGYAGRNSQNKRERIWFSPHCLPANRLSLFEDMQ